MVYTESGKISEIQNILKFNKDMNKTFVYGLAVNGIIDKNRNTTSEDYDKLYKFASPIQFKKQNGGICWDYVTYETDYLNKHFPNVKYTAYYVIFDNKNDLPTHTFIILNIKDQYIYFESSFKKIQGIYSSKSKRDIINFVLDSMNKYGSSNNLLEYPYYVFKYDPLDQNLYNLNCSQFMKYIEDHGTQVMHKFSKDFNVIKL